MPTHQQPRYQSYLLRFWEESDLPRASGVWRFSLEDPRTGERRGFCDLEHLLAFLGEQMNNPLKQKTQ